MKNSKIEWTDHTFNPWIGCTKVSAGCANCYAEALSKRYGRDSWGPGKERKRTGLAYWRQPLLWDKAAAATGDRHRVFCASMADVFDKEVPPEWRNDLFDLIKRTRNLDWLILTKRPEYARDLIAIRASTPLEKLWLGVSVENQRQALARIPVLLSIPAAVRFLSVEPMLEPVSLMPWLIEPHNRGGIDWIICGGESGPRCRPFSADWAAELAFQAELYGVPFFMKQLGGHPDKRGEMADFPESLRVRQFPALHI